MWLITQKGCFLINQKIKNCKKKWMVLFCQGTWPKSFYEALCTYSRCVGELVLLTGLNSTWEEDGWFRLFKFLFNSSLEYLTSNLLSEKEEIHHILCVLVPCWFLFGYFWIGEQYCATKPFHPVRDKFCEFESWQWSFHPWPGVQENLISPGAHGSHRQIICVACICWSAVVHVYMEHWDGLESSLRCKGVLQPRVSCSWYWLWIYSWTSESVKKKKKKYICAIGLVWENELELVFWLVIVLHDTCINLYDCFCHHFCFVSVLHT